ncbi:MAG: hypothetical protein A2289_25490 [Deltaproteobacteria bacterium RIFOXYA12_FULL_58_15]|nr:MAG: hypothetical protein A2289_25490 [Deltaproteobacteria bacterium RIFOXYA12_FULL_58_15]OGR10568.1 MAG: hypothetical protein A2341_09790 [Deltaproteobacteria bacterium RIFOXYB12_FULL_58_9]
MRTTTVAGLERRLAWLLVFRAVIATCILVVTIVADVANWQLRLMSVVLYGVVIGSYLFVFGLGLLLRTSISRTIISTVHLTTTVMAALMVVQATGGVVSGFSFLYLLAILDGTIIGGRTVALIVATVSSLSFGGQLVLQLYGVFNAGLPELPVPDRFIVAVLSHMAAFYLVAILGGQLAQMLESARAAASTAQIDLHRVEAFQAAVLASLPVGVLTAGPKRMVQTVNQAARRILEVDENALIGQPLPEELAAILDENATLTEVSVMVRGQAKHLSVSRSTTRYPLAQGRASSQLLEVLVFEDRTELERLKDELRANEKLASLGELAAAIAHELRNPLAAISGSVELLGGVAADSEEHAKLEAIVLREIERLNKLVNDFLAYARPSPLVRVQTDIATLIRDVCAVAGQDKAGAAHSIELNLPASLVGRVDSSQLRQVLWNLLHNARQASPAYAPICVSLEQCSNERAALIVVRDWGQGVDPEMRAHLFEPFVTTKRGGTGMGLAVVKNIVRAHGGEVNLASAQGGGTEARVKLPLGAEVE